MVQHSCLHQQEMAFPRDGSVKKDEQSFHFPLNAFHVRLLGNVMVLWRWSGGRRIAKWFFLIVQSVKTFTRCNPTCIRVLLAALCLSLLFFFVALSLCSKVGNDAHLASCVVTAFPSAINSPFLLRFTLILPLYTFHVLLLSICFYWYIASVVVVNICCRRGQ